MLVFVYQLFWLAAFANAEHVILDTKQGTLRGQVEQSRNGRSFFAFYSIPYAKPPLGDLRFQNPVPAQSWEGIRNATVFPPACIYTHEIDGLQGDEDCLYLNVYTPKLTRETLLPVMVYISGGRFLHAHARTHRFGNQYIMDKDVILVTFHYRQGALGFLSTEDTILPGNYGLKDFVTVLKWVQNNIDSFGGDKYRVTAWGASTGAITSSLALVSPLTKGLFHRVISQSGFPFWMMAPGVARKGAWKFASLVGCDDNVISSQDLLECLRKLPAESIVSQQLKLKVLGDLLPPLLFGPVIEDERVPGAFLVDDSAKLLSRHSDIPWMLGMTSGEGGMLSIATYYNSHTGCSKELAEQYHTVFPVISGFKRETDNVTKLRQITEKLREHYFGNTDISTNALAFSKMMTTTMFVSAMKVCAELYKGPMYAYYFDHESEMTMATFFGDPKEYMGVVHGDDNHFLFNRTEFTVNSERDIDKVVSEQMLALWTNFAAYGNPNGNGATVWEPVKSTKIEHLVIKDGLLEMKNEFLKEESEFLRTLSAIASSDARD